MKTRLKGFVWCLAQPDILRIVSASIFGLFCLMYQSKDAQTMKGMKDE